MKPKRILSVILAVCTILSVLAGFSFTASAATVEYVEVAANTELAEVSKDYGLAKNIQDGNILHCFNWKYNDIKAELPNIAAAGFTSVQTSPAQPAGSGEWYWLYQPYGFYIGSNALGSKSDLQSLCTEADKYGIKVVVDVVANHLNGDTGRVQDDLRDGQYWHNYGTVSNWADRYQVTQGEIGMRDLNSEHSYVQQKVASYMKELEAVGVDGIRWDAAKHIALPSENCNFWRAVTSNNSMWHYGEILVGPSDGGGTEGLMKEYTNYMSVTDSVYGGDVRNAFAGGNVPGSNGNWVNRGIAPNKLVLWGESHDTYSNGAGEWGASTNMSQNVIDRAYAVVASRNGSNALYFSRPGATDKSSIHSGQKGSTSFKSAEITAVNQLKNACANEKDYYQSTNGCAVVNRESGAVIVLGGGGNRDVSVANGGGITKPGTYKDLVTGSTWTVTSSQMSGKVGQNGIAVLLNAKPAGPSASVSPDSKNYTTDTLELTLSFDNATSGQYSINGGAYQSFTNGQKITIGKGTVAGTQTTISVKAINGSTTSDVETYEYNYAELADTGIYCDTTGTNWSSVNCYIYKNGQGYKEWPGEAMTSVGDNLWYYEVPAGFENCQVIFSQGGNNQYPAEEGLSYSGGAMIYSDGQWQQHTVVKPNTTPTTVPTQPTTAPTKPTEAPTQPTVAPTQPTQAPVKTDPTEDNSDIVVIPPAPVTKPTNPSPTPTNPIASGEKYRYGDIDLNGKITIKDVTTIQKALAKINTLSTIQLIVSDVNGDGKINVKDVSTIQKFCATIISSFTVGEWYTVPGASTVEPTEVTTQKPVETDPTEVPTQPTEAITQPTVAPTQPTAAPTQPTAAPTQPTEAPTQPTEAPTQSVTTPVADGMITVYFKNDYKWSNVKAHYWNSDGSKSTTWPGESMTLVSGDYYSITISDDNVNIVFSDNGNYQTADLSIPGVNKYYSTDTNQWHNYTGNTGNSSDSNNSNQGNYIYFKDTENWNCAYAHTWGNGETTWPGTRMDYVEGNLFRIEVPAGHTQVVFNDGNNNRKTADINIEIGKAYNYSTGQWETV